MVISRTLLEEINEKSRKLKGAPEYHLARDARLKGDLKTLCNLHSFWLEHPDLRMGLLDSISLKDNRGTKKFAREGIGRIHEAWNYLNSIGLGYEFLKEFNTMNLIRTGQIIEPNANTGGHRNSRCLLKNMSYVPPNFMKVPELTSELLEDLKTNLYHPVEAAGLAHVEILGIQPLNDGNKRLARLVQDRILADNDLPPACIPYGEREVYLDLAEQYLLAKDRVGAPLQRPFFDYNGGKVNTALDNILDDLKIRMPIKRNTPKKKTKTLTP